MATKKTMYEKPIEGTYHFKIYEYATGRLIPGWCSCKVLGETEKQYQIQIYAALPKHAQGDIMWVRKEFVKFKS